MNVTIAGHDVFLLHPGKLVPWEEMVYNTYGGQTSPLSPMDVNLMGKPVPLHVVREYYHACHAYAKGGPVWERWQREHPQ